MTRSPDTAGRFRLRLAAVLLAFFAAGTASSMRAADLPVFQEGTSGDNVCVKCHGANEKKPVLAIHRTRHGAVAQPGCQACHGSSRAHVMHKDDAVERPAPDFVFSGVNRSAPETLNRTCLNCHKGGKRLLAAGSVHPANDLTCANCHKVHATEDAVLQREQQAGVCFACHKQQRAESLYPSNHGFAGGKVVCSDCHNPHGSSAPKLLVKPTLNETCFACHADKRGPFLWEHPPASDDCSHCHNPHGSAHAPLLKSRPPWLCQS
ncbi:MAG TPA: DmsE family decaheme c-type cytochrome, partial [Usitatibacteraceae bacterium]|nr:DmsE family decaheme c-type cytochrome [Usitatibacteraceae bacterium]